MKPANKKLKRKKKLAEKKKLNARKKHERNRQLKSFSTTSMVSPYDCSSQKAEDLRITKETAERYIEEHSLARPLPMVEVEPEGISLHPWHRELRKQFIRKYGDLESADPYLRYCILEYHLSQIDNI